jgi:hypothetical protein
MQGAQNLRGGALTGAPYDEVAGNAAGGLYEAIKGGNDNGYAENENEVSRIYSISPKMSGAEETFCHWSALFVTGFS